MLTFLRMNIVPVFKALKFYDLKPERRVRLWFLSLFVLYAASFLLPIANPDFTSVVLALFAFLEGSGGMPVLEAGHLNFLLLQLLTRIVAVFALADYLRYFLRQPEAGPLPIRLKTWLRIVLYQMVLGIVYLFSTQFLLIPYFFFVSYFFFVVPELIMHGGTLPKAFEQSHLLGRGVRFSIASTFLLFTAFFMTVSLVVSTIGDPIIGGALLGGFAYAWEVLAGAKLIGMMYRSLRVTRTRLDHLMRTR